MPRSISIESGVSRRFARRVVVAAALGAAVGCSDRSGPDGDPGPADLGPFVSAETCGECHPQHLADWEASMHSYGGVDPIMLRMAEMADAEAGPGEAGGDDCRACHAPALRRQQQWLDANEPFFATLAQDLTHDGINCDVCHSVQIVPPVGEIGYLDEVDPAAPKRGGIFDPIDNSFHPSVGDAAFVTSSQCAPCHQIDLEDGTGIENTFREWQLSSFSAFGRECQDCHMPEETGPAAVDGPDRTIHRHFFTGVDYALEDFRGIDRDAQQERVAELLRNSVAVEATLPTSVAPSAAFDVSIRVVNDRTGHSIPSGTSFSREMWLDVRVVDGAGNEWLRSGALDASDDLIEDASLVSFGSVARDANGDRTFFSWRMATIDESAMLAHGTARTGTWSVDVPSGATGEVTIEMALRFRSFRPSILREIGLERLLPIRVFTMWEEARTIPVTAPAR